MTCIHLETNEFLDLIRNTGMKVTTRCYFLSCGIAAKVYVCQDNNFFYYLDRPFSTPEKEHELRQQDPYEIHKDLYRIVNLMEYYRSLQA